MNTWGDIQGGKSGLRWLVLDLNSYFASCEQQANPALRGQPIIIVPMLADSTCAIAASYEAKAHGIKTGTPVWEAKRLCPGLRLVQAKHRLYVDYHHRILEAIETCIPIEDVMSIDEVACRLDKVQQEPEQARTLALRMKASIRARVGECLTSSIGIASNKLLAKLASDMQKPDGLVMLNPDDMPQPILHLKPDAICGIGPNMAARLHHAGIHDMATLWATDAQRMRRIWNGINGVRFHALLHGADLPSPTHPRRSMGHQHVLAPEERTMERALPVVRQLLIRAAQRLRAEGFFCRRMILVIKWQQELGYFVQESRLAETQDTAVLLHALMAMWHAAPNLRPLRVGVTLSDLVAQTAHQPDLFEQAKPKPAALTTAIDRINDKFGRGAVTYGCAVPAMTSKISFQRVPEVWEVS